MRSEHAHVSINLQIIVSFCNHFHFNNT